MWPPWGKAKSKAKAAKAPKAKLPRAKAAGSPATSTPAASCSSPYPLRPSFSFSSLKDLADDDPDPPCSRWCFHPATSTSRSPKLTPAPVLHRVRSASTAVRTWRSSPEDPFKLPPGKEKRVVLYYTSLRVVRKTFEDCRAVRFILRGFRVAVDERDIGMDAGFREELRRILGRARGQQQVAVPQVFIGGRYVGGAEELRQLHEAGELKRYLDGVAPAVDGGECGACGSVRFLPCGRCGGSHKYYVEKGGGGGGFRSCCACNENGLIRCPRCCAAF